MPCEKVLAPDESATFKSFYGADATCIEVSIEGVGTTGQIEVPHILGDPTVLEVTDSGPTVKLLQFWGNKFTVKNVGSTTLRVASNC